MTNASKIKEWLIKQHFGTMYTVPSLEGFNTESRDLNDRFANEDGQNRKDACDDKTKPVLVRIEEKIIKSESFYKNYIQGLEKNLSYTKNRHHLVDKNKIKILIIECFNTVGLTGSFEDSDNDNYERFFSGSAESKSGSSGGRRQLGRHTYMLASKLKGMFAYSIEKQNKTRFLRGIQYLGKFIKDGKKMDPYSAFTYKYDSVENQNKDETFPILDKEELDEFRKITGLSRKNETGLSVIIPEPIETLNGQKVFNSYIKRFFPALLTNTLRVEFKSSTENKFIDVKNVEEHLIKNKILSEKWIDFFKEAYTTDDKSLHKILKSEDYNYEETLSKDDFSTNEIEKIREDYQKNKPVTVKAYVKIPFEKDKPKEEIGFFKASIKKKSFDDQNVPALYLRGNLQIPREKRYFKFSKSAYVVLWSDDDKLSELLGDSEGMAHDSWNSNHHDVTEFYNPEVKKVFKYIKSFLNTFFSIITDKDNQIDFETFSDDLPTKEDIYKDEDIKQKEIIIPEENVPNEADPPKPKPDAMRKMVQEIPVQDGFKIIKTDACENNNFPMKVRVKFAYRARGKNSFNCYDKNIHFDLSKEKDIKISQKKNLDVLITSGNELDILALKPDFELEISGFKDLDKKDLDVRARKLKS